VLPKKAPLVAESSEKSGLESQGKTPVLCIAGRGPLDELASIMLAQLLGKHGINAQSLPNDAVSRASIGSLQIHDIAMVCVLYLEISGSSAHLRFLLMRLRKRLPNASILVGLWAVQDPNLRQMIGADYYVSTLHDAVQACVMATRQVAQPTSGITTPTEQVKLH
jgi:hypothetical protein